jgi:hypothetical protein
MNTISNAFPRAIILGIQDLSGTTPVYETTPVPTHLPLCYFYGQWGPEDTLLLSGDAVTETYGAETFEVRKAYYNHATLFLDHFRARQTVMTKRIVPADAKQARLLLSLDIVAEQITEYERMPDGSFKYDNNGQKVPTGTKVAGYKARWVLNDWTVGVDQTKAFGQMTQKTGGLVSESDQQSIQYPIMDVLTSFRGRRGNDIGFRLSAPTTLSADALDADLLEQIKARLYRFQAVQRPTSTSTGAVVETLGGSQYIDFSFEEGMYNPNTDTELGYDQTLLPGYRNLDEPGVPAIYGPYQDFHVYSDNLKAVLAMVGAAEAPLGLLHPDVLEIDADSEWLNIVNIFTGENGDGVPYGAYQLLGPADGGTLLTPDTTLYAAGGSDGTMNAQAFDQSVQDEFLAWAGNSYPLLDPYGYPVTAIWDPGYSLATKKAMFTVLGRRPDIAVIVSTQDANQPQNSDTEDDSMAVALRAAASAYPESVFYGTKVARVLIHAQSGYLINHPYKKLVPLSLQLAVKTSDYMGAASGRWNETLAYDQEGNNMVTLFRGINNTWRPANARKKDWENGLIWVQKYDHKSFFYPAVQTIYEDDSSVLNSSINMWAAIEGIRACYRSWRSITGNSGLTPQQVVARINGGLEADLEPSRFGNRFVFVPQAFYSKSDTQRGYSYSCKVNIFAPNMITVGQYTVAMHRRADLEASAA